MAGSLPAGALYLLGLFTCWGSLPAGALYLLGLFTCWGSLPAGAMDQIMRYLSVCSGIEAASVAVPVMRWIGERISICQTRYI